MTKYADVKMEKQPQDKEHIYSKKEIIGLYAFWFVLITMFTIIPSILFDILPDNYFVYTLLQGCAYFIVHKRCQRCIKNHIQSDTQVSADIFNWSMSENFGSTAINSYKHETNFYSGSSLTSSTNTYMLNNIINK